MRSRFASIVILTIVTAAAVAAVRSSESARRPDPQGLTVHEWGTFTSIAGIDGTAELWAAKDGTQDLPCFVKRVSVCPKCDLTGTVRMETPVLYFYAAKPMTASVDVGFKQGAITEWFPDASVAPRKVDQKELANAGFESSIAWPEVKILPGTTPALLSESGASHYYAARATDAAPVRIGDADEKFLFYRGVGRFAPPIAATVSEDGTVSLWNPDDQRLGDVILFENRNGVVSWQLQSDAGNRVSFSRFSPGGNAGTLRPALEKLLVAQGLFDKEAAAMVATWRDSWFEEGTRLFYIVPKTSIDSILPLAIKPRPVETARVFVGRLEIFTSERLQEAREAMTSANLGAIKSYGRFFGPMMTRILAKASSAERSRLQAGLTNAYMSETPVGPPFPCR